MSSNGAADFDVVVVGASIAGCTAATLYGRAGLRVALLESHSDPAAYKTLCTHYIQPSATPTLERLGMHERIRDAGGVPNRFRAWSRWGYLEGTPDRVHGWNLRRSKLDPILRDMAGETAGVELRMGSTAVGLIEDGGRVSGVEVETRDGERQQVPARLVVGADGRSSRVAKLAGVREKTRPNNRFGYFAYFRDVPLDDEQQSQLWLMEPDGAFLFPNDEGVVMLGAYPAKDKLASFKENPVEALHRWMDRVPDGPDLSKAEQFGKVIGMVDYPNISRTTVRPGLALVGDAAMVCDPLWGVGCGFAFQTAEWLVDSTAPALAGQESLDRGLRRYRRLHRRRLGLHHLVMCEFATARRFRAPERLVISAAVKDQWLADVVLDVTERWVGAERMLSPRIPARALRVKIANR